MNISNYPFAASTLSPVGQNLLMPSLNLKSMARFHIPLRILILIAATTASPAPALFFSRQDVCKAQGLTACSNGLPDNFCCGDNSKCLALAGNTTVLCCPNDRGCTKIQPITCDLAAQDPTKNPNAPIKTSVTGAKLPICGENFCCPFGYSCVDDNSCQLDPDQSKKPEGATTTSRPSTIATTTTVPTSTAAQPTAPTSTATTDKSTDSPSSGPEKTSIIGGAIGGVLALLLVAVIIFLCVRSRSGGKAADKSVASSRSSGSGPYGTKISSPIPVPNAAGVYRTDFTGAVRESISKRFSRTPQIQLHQATNPRASIPNPFASEHSPAMTRSSFASHDEGYARTGQVAGALLPPIRSMKASSKCSRRTSTLNVQREPSSESINVFADPKTVDSNANAGGTTYNRGTTFSDLMEEANMGDVHKGGAYIPRTPRRHVPGTTPKI